MKQIKKHFCWVVNYEKTAKLWSTFKKWQKSRNNCHFLDKRFLMGILKFWNNPWDGKNCLFLSNEIFLQAGSYFTWKNKLEPFTFLNLLFFPLWRWCTLFLCLFCASSRDVLMAAKGFLNEVHLSLSNFNSKGVLEKVAFRAG